MPKLLYDLQIPILFSSLDSVLVTHWGIDNILGLKTILPTVFKPSNDQSLLCLLTPPPNINNMKINNHTQDPLPFTINLPMYFSNLVGEIKRSGTNLMVYPVTRGGKQSVVPKPLQLFQKVSHFIVQHVGDYTKLEQSLVSSDRDY